MIKRKLFEQFEKCRLSGECNMLDRSSIFDYALENKLVELCNMTIEQHSNLIKRFGYYSEIYKKGDKSNGNN